ncbi:P-loop containing nucleoside triphosphate hydrolase protein [Dimargaris cristalligena]|uniref:P-loop containing nucleoside triphosphate hydrolase protein n=1 Tax=Dimargaris cristalligena TaxID=215637 RepID=A0A4P9ZXR8_9FUNG|nr:P-loop containing nucleoside triphosphate hydrolase protein [Dimargaris cristalligena]|eukprot:RKP38447.1 P-loop containing nucleoside triphosphate hydrolase protein [Dimargaris cristalligena]
MARLRGQGVDEMIMRWILTHVFQPYALMSWDAIAGLEGPKKTMRETVIFPLLRPDLFTGIRAPPRGLLLYGPPGGGKTLLVRAAAHQARSAFFHVTPGVWANVAPEQRSLFLQSLSTLASEMSPSVVFWDDLDFLLHPTSRTGGNGGDGNNPMQPVTSGADWSVEFGRRTHTSSFFSPSIQPPPVVWLAATNRPELIPETLRRKFLGQVYLPLPDLMMRYNLIMQLLRGSDNHYHHNNAPSSAIAGTAVGYSYPDIQIIGKEAAFQPIREIADSQQLLTMSADAIRPVSVTDWRLALRHFKSPMDPVRSTFFKQWHQLHGGDHYRR